MTHVGVTRVSLTAVLYDKNIPRCNAPQIKRRLTCHRGIRRNDPRLPSRTKRGGPPSAARLPGPPPSAWRCLRISGIWLKINKILFFYYIP